MWLGESPVEGAETLGEGWGGESVSQVPQCAPLKLGFFHTIGLSSPVFWFLLYKRWLWGSGESSPARATYTHVPTSLFLRLF